MTAIPTIAPTVELIGIEKRFGAVAANRGISFTLRPGTVHGLIGENGAGKSTLAHILYGQHQPDAGEIRIDGRAIRFRNPSDAIAAGIGMVHQHFMLVEPFTVLENLMLGSTGSLFEARAAARTSLDHLAREYGLAVHPDAVVGALPVGLQQRVEILKALHRGARLLILDEPTAVLTPAEAEAVFRMLRVLAAEGRSVLLVTHKLKEVMAVTQRVTVLRHGAVVADLATAEAEPAVLAEHMIGRKPTPPARRATAPGPVVLEVDDLAVADDEGALRLKGVSFALRAREILGIAGVAGNGQSELLAAIAGLAPVARGRIRLQGIDITGSDARSRRRIGISHIPEDRLRLGLIPEFDATETALLGRHEEPEFGGLLMRRKPALRAVADWMRRYDVRPPAPDHLTGLFSGGNQQKLICAREIERRPVLLLVGQPTRGVDIGAIELIHDRLLALCAAGAAILLVSVELDEIRALADRILVVSEGAVVGEVSSSASDAEIGLLMAGVGADRKAMSQHAPDNG